MNKFWIILILAVVAIGGVWWFYGERSSKAEPGRVLIENFRFNPEKLTIKKGGTMEWKNRDVVSHTVTSTTFDSGKIAPRGIFRYTFGEAGIYEYGCSTHPSMRGSIEVVNSEGKLVLSPVAGGLTAPLGIVSSKDGAGRLFIADQIGLVRILDDKGVLKEMPFLDLRAKMTKLDANYDERGLLGLAFHPGFKDNGRFFVLYTVPLKTGGPAGWDHTSRISEFKVDKANPDRASISSERIVLEINHPQSNHNGGQLVFGRDGYLYISSGDGGGADDVGEGHVSGGNGQSLDTLLGKILRIDVDASPYGIPGDNPFVGGGALPEIFAYGFRNPYRMSFDESGNLFVADVGQNRWEEIDIVEKGGNYGWNLKEGTHCFDPQNPNENPASCPKTGKQGEALISPVMDYLNAQATGGIGHAIIGGLVYRGNLIPWLKGKYVFGDWSRQLNEGDGSLFIAEKNSVGIWQKEEVFPDNKRIGAYVRGFGEDERGEIYLLTSGMAGPSAQTGKVFKIAALD